VVTKTGLTVFLLKMALDYNKAYSAYCHMHWGENW
jgi:hypothetical protein